ncbi:hypothetical protein F0562_033082 [Nyssa sinensis]|uniref:DUSP domain-containing protein n=1 Tax=Nyssa sinensis TaxID=561372 RepID=A0A5J5AQH0_9ASTE|nr:hypothetical protein F0562_033082 [Nyssa sinensis]
MPEQAPGARRSLVPESLWLFFCETANSVKPDDPLDCSTFPSDSQPCAQCSMELTEVACLENNLRQFKLKQHQNHDKLASGKSIALNPLCRFYLLPSSWLSKWKNYITASGKNTSSEDPETLNSVIDLLKCEKGKL